MHTVFKVLVGVFCALWIFKEIALPLGVGAWLSEEYMRLVIKCDSAMEASWYGDTADVNEKRAQDIHLLDCHEYDKTRKTMLTAGLPEVYLSWLGLQALEIYQRPASEMSEQHRFTER